MEKSAVWAPVPKQKVSIVEREGPGWTVWLDSQGDGDCPICGTRHPIPGHAKGRRLAPCATLHMSQNGMWGDRHAQAGQRPSSTQSEAEPI
jgi:hypothetical protein